MTMTKNWIVIVAAGSGTRFGSDKILAKWMDKPIIWYSVNTARQVCPNIVIVANKNNIVALKQILGEDIIFVAGGETRTQSVKNGLAQLPSDTNLVAIHDGARPFATSFLFKTLFEQAEQKGSAVPVTAETDTLYSTLSSSVTPIPRESVKKAQTPQVFNYGKLLEAYADNPPQTDDGQIWLKKHGKLNLVQGENTNVKITYPQDLAEYRVGVGFDAHQLAYNRKLILCGVEIPFEKGLLGHSDADVAFHALADAILSAIGEKDIGNLFPDSDPKYLGIDSGILLDEVWKKATSEGYSLCNASLTLVAQSPKLSPYVSQMKQNIAQRLTCTQERVNLTATTTENLGITAEGKGMACHATVLLTKTNY